MEQVKCDNNCEECIIYSENLPTDRAKRLEIYNKLGLCVSVSDEEAEWIQAMKIHRAVKSS